MNGPTVLDRQELLGELQTVFNRETAEVVVGVLEKTAARIRQPSEEYRELRAVVGDLAAAQRQTAEEVRGLAAAQRRTEEAVAQWAERTVRLEEAMALLAERTGKMEEAITLLTARTGKLEEAMTLLTQRTGKLEEAIATLTDGIGQLRRQVGGLSETVGGDIEDIAYIVVHEVLGREFGWQVGPLERTWQRWDGVPEEVNLFGSATDPKDPDRQIWIVGEAKHNLTEREVDRFQEQVLRARRNLKGEVFPLCFCYRARPEVQQAVREAGIRLVFSYGKLV